MEDEIQIKEEPIDNYGFRKKNNQTQMSENLNHIKTESYGPVFEDSQSKSNPRKKNQTQISENLNHIKTESYGPVFEDSQSKSKPRKKKNQTQISENLNHIKTESYGPVFEDSQSKRIVCLIKTEVDDNTFKEEDAVANTYTESDGHYPAKIKPEIKLEGDPIRIVSTDSRIGEIIIGNNANESLHQRKTTDCLGNQRFARYQCHLCSYRTAKLANFELHNTIHTPFSCYHCKYRAATKADIRVHLRIHASEKTYKCPSCDYRTSFVSCLEKHELYHGREKKFVCKLCNYSTSLRLKLKQHVLLKHTI